MIEGETIRETRREPNLNPRSHPLPSLFLWEFRDWVRPIRPTRVHLRNLFRDYSMGEKEIENRKGSVFSFSLSIYLLLTKNGKEKSFGSSWTPRKQFPGTRFMIIRSTPLRDQGKFESDAARYLRRDVFIPYPSKSRTRYDFPMSRAFQSIFV